MGLKKKKILGIGITTNSRDEILEEVKKRLGHTSIIVTPNPEQLVMAQTNTELAEVLNGADIAIPDGVGLAWAAGVQRIPGVEFMEDLVQLSVKQGVTIGLIGGWHGVAVEALERLQKKYPGLQGWALEPENVKDGVYPQADIVFVALGAPKQEYLIHSLSFRPSLPQRRLGSRNPVRKTWIPGQARDDSTGVVFMAVGGAFDILAGRTARAPLLLRTIGVEWLWRLVREPWRWRRQLSLLKFLWLVFLERY